MIRISSSQFPAACGTSPFVSRPKLYRVVSFGETIESNDYMERGKRLEKLAVAAVEAELGCVFNNTGDAQVSRQVQVGDIVLSSTPDGHLGPTGLEVKIRENLSGEPPLKSLPQLCGQMMIWGFEEVIYAELASSLRIWRVFRSEALERAVTEAVEVFASFVRSGTQPPRWSSKKAPRPEISMPLYERLV